MLESKSNKNYLTLGSDEKTTKNEKRCNYIPVKVSRRCTWRDQERRVR